MFTLDKGLKRTLELRNQLYAATFGRRELAKLGLIAGGASYAQGASLRQALAGTVPTVKLTPWKDRLPIPDTAKSSPYDYDHKNHQHCDKYPADAGHCYELKCQEFDHNFHSDLPDSSVWSFNKSFGGPVLDVRYGTPVCLQLENELPANHQGYGQPETTSHMHNFHTASESDGGPWNWLKPGQHRYQHYCMTRAGFMDPKGPANPYYKDASGRNWWATDGGAGDLRETLTTLFFHDHRPEFTGPNLYKGLFMMVRAFDQDDTGDETKGWRLPSGKYDVPLMFQDKQILPDSGEMVFDQFSVDGFLGNYLTVNGKIKPYMEVERRKYRFRLLDGGPSRFYRFALRSGGKYVKFDQITESGNLLYMPRKGLQELDLWVAERSDIIVDFSAMPDGTEVVMSNTLSMRADGRGEEVGKKLNPDDPANQLLKFVVKGSQAADDPSRVPSTFRPVAPTPDLSKLPRKLFKFERKNGQWAINGKFWDPDIDHSDELIANPTNVVKRDSAEIWTLDSSSGGWDHPMHIHFEEGQILSQNGVGVPLAKRHRYDIYRLRQNKMEVLLRFRDYPQDGFTPSAVQVEQTKADHGRYVMHCHNVVHEDHSMMTTWSIKA